MVGMDLTNRTHKLDLDPIVLDALAIPHAHDRLLIHAESERRLSSTSASERTCPRTVSPSK